MTKPVNKHPLRYGNEHGEIRFGHIIKEKQFGYLVRTGEDGGRHYIRMRSNGDARQGQKGSTQIHAPGTVSINCGEDIRKAKSKDGGKIAEPRGFNLVAENGDISIFAKHGTIRLAAQNIELISTENDGRNGNITLDAAEKLTLKAPDVECTSTVCTKIVSANQVNVIGEAITNVYGGLMEFADGFTATVGSKNSNKESAKAGKLSSALEDIMRDVPTTMEAAAIELKKSGAGVAGKLKELATSDEVANLTEQLEGVGEELSENLTQFEVDTKKLSDKFGTFFKDNL